MQSFWQRVWFYTRIVLISFIAVNVVIFVVLNLSAVVEPAIRLNFFRTYDRPNLLVVLLMTALTSILGWWLFWTIFRTVRQLREARNRARVDRLQRDLDDMKVKAARLQYKGAPAGPAAVEPAAVETEPPADPPR